MWATSPTSEGSSVSVSSITKMRRHSGSEHRLAARPQTRTRVFTETSDDIAAWMMADADLTAKPVKGRQVRLRQCAKHSSHGRIFPSVETYDLPTSRASRLIAPRV